MLYQPDQMALWPRLLTTARSIDTDLATALTELLQQGAYLATRQDGLLQLSAGAMDPAAYEQFKTTRMAPRVDRLRTIVQRAATLTHPWRTAVQTAYQDVDARVQRGHKALTAAIEARDMAKIAALAPTLLDRRTQAISLGSALMLAGIGAYVGPVSDHTTAYIDLAHTVEKARIPWEATGKCWPVDTPDGRIWVIDAPDAECRLVKDGQTLEQQPGEPAVTDWELGNALAPLEVAEGQWWREGA